MKTKPKSTTSKQTASKKPTVAPLDGKPKVKLGTGRHLAYVSDTLFDEDLYQ